MKVKDLLKATNKFNDFSVFEGEFKYIGYYSYDELVNSRILELKVLKISADSSGIIELKLEGL